MTSHRARDDLAWNYVRPIKACRPFMQFDLIAPNTYELVVLDGLPSKVATNSDDPPNSFHTSDTWCPHPTINDAWKYIGRLDDRITLVNGEKVLPISMEHQVRTNEYVHECWIFGIGKALPGIMIVPSAKAEGLSTTEIFETIWPSIQAANGHVEGFSQISKEMVTILDIGTEYPSTDKGTMIRAKTYVKFAEQIEDTYIRFENGPVDRAELLTLGIEELENWLANAFSELGVNKLDASTDLFAAGVDSLQAITVFGLIKRELDVGSAIVGQNVVFEYPSVSNLAQHLFSLRTGEDISVKDELTLMADLIEKYSTFATHQPSTSEPEKETIVSHMYFSKSLRTNTMAASHGCYRLTWSSCFVPTYYAR
jgi:acyl carrier protein